MKYFNGSTCTYSRIDALTALMRGARLCVEDQDFAYTQKVEGGRYTVERHGAPSPREPFLSAENALSCAEEHARSGRYRYTG